MYGTPSTPPSDASTTREQVQLGGRIVELEPSAAETVRQAYAELANAYGASLEEQRRQILSTIGTPHWQPAAPAPMEPAIDVPDPDLMFQNKDAWAAGLAQNLEHRIRHAQGEQAALVQGAVNAVDLELRRRDQRAEAQRVHDETMEEMLERRKLGDHRRIVQTIYNEQYGNLQHLPLGVAIDQLGAMAEQEIASIRGEQPTTAAAPEAAAPPAPRPFLRSARGAGGGAAAPAAPTSGKTLTQLILAHHARAIHGEKAA